MSLETTATVTLAGQEYVAKAVPVGKLVKLAKELGSIAETLTSVDTNQADQAFEEFVAQLGTSLDTFFRTFIPTLPEGIFADEENGPTLPEIIEAVKTIAKLNRMDTLGNLARQLGLSIRLQTASHSTS